MPNDPAPLVGRVALVTGVSRDVGIGAAVARRLEALGAAVFATGWPAHDESMAWGAGDFGVPDLEVEQRDLIDPAAPAALVDAVVQRHGAIDIVVAVHARGSGQSLWETTADELDASWAANVRSIVLLARALGERHEPGRKGGRMLWFTSGQHLGPMPGEIPYAITKGALHTMTATIADALAERGIVANCINPGPVDTGWATPAARQAIARRFPSGRWGTPDDVCNLVEFLVRDEGEWICGQVIDSEGGFRRQG